MYFLFRTRKYSTSRTTVQYVRRRDLIVFNWVKFRVPDKIAERDSLQWLTILGGCTPVYKHRIFAKERSRLVRENERRQLKGSSPAPPSFSAKSIKPVQCRHTKNNHSHHELRYCRHLQLGRCSRAGLPKDAVCGCLSGAAFCRYVENTFLIVIFHALENTI
jgi:hypothetical protein